MNANTTLGRFRLVALLEGISYLILMGIGMPLKYGYQIFWPIKVLGYTHGFLFLVFLLLLVEVWKEQKWAFKDVVIAFVASLLPFGTILMDRKWRKLA